MLVYADTTPRLSSRTLFRTVEYPNLPIVAKKTGKTGYKLTGPGSAWMELDAALHRAIGVGAAAVTTWLTTRTRARR